MAVIRPRLTDYHGILRAQAELDFAIPFFDEDTRNIALDLVDEIEDKASQDKPKIGVITALLAALPHVANVATIAASIVALLPK